MLGALFQASQEQPTATPASPPPDPADSSTPAGGGMPEVTVSGKDIVPEVPPPPVYDLSKIPKWMWFLPNFQQGLMGRLALRDREWEAKRDAAWSQTLRRELNKQDDEERMAAETPPGQPTAPPGAAPPPGVAPATPGQPGPINTGTAGGPAQRQALGQAAGIDGAAAGPQPNATTGAMPSTYQAPTFSQLSVVPPQIMNRARRQADMANAAYRAAVNTYQPAKAMEALKEAGAVDKEFAELQKLNIELTDKRIGAMSGALEDMVQNTDEGTPERQQAFEKFVRSFPIQGLAYATAGMRPTDANIHSMIMDMGGAKAELDWNKAQVQMDRQRAATDASRASAATQRFVRTQIMPRKIALLDKTIGLKGITPTEINRVDALMTARKAASDMLDIMARNKDAWYGGKAGYLGRLGERAGYLFGHNIDGIKWENKREELAEAYARAQNNRSGLSPSGKKAVDPLVKWEGILDSSNLVRDQIIELRNDIQGQLDLSPEYKRRMSPDANAQMSDLDSMIDQANKAQEQATREQEAAAAEPTTETPE